MEGAITNLRVILLDHLVGPYRDEKLLQLEKDWILNLGTFGPTGVNTRNQLLTGQRRNWGNWKGGGNKEQGVRGHWGCVAVAGREGGAWVREGPHRPISIGTYPFGEFFSSSKMLMFFKLGSVLSSQLTTFRFGRRHIPSWIVEILCDHWRLEIKTEVLSTTAIPNVSLACEEGERLGAQA